MKEEQMNKRKTKLLASQGLLEPDLVFDIDKNCLDEEWINQPKRFFNMSLQLEDARDELRTAKAELKLVEAEVGLDIRANPEKYDLTKLTENLILSAVINSAQYQDAQTDINNLEYKIGVLKAAVTSLDQRKTGLENLVYLHGQKYFATPRALGQSKEAVSNIEKQAARVKSKVRRKKEKS